MFTLISLIVFVIIYFYFMFHLYIQSIAVYVCTSLHCYVSTVYTPFVLTHNIPFYASSPLKPLQYILRNHMYPCTFGINHTFPFYLSTCLRVYFVYGSFSYPCTFGIYHTFPFYFSMGLSQYCKKIRKIPQLH